MPQALLIVDIQNDYFPGGAMTLVGSEAAAQRAAALLAEFRDHRLPVIHVRHLSNRPGATFFVPDTPGAEIHAAVAPAAGETVVTKHFPNAFRETTLAEVLAATGVRNLTVAGMMTHMCVDATVRAAADAGFNCTLAHDACATRDLGFGDTQVPAAQVQAAFLAALNGSYANVCTTDEAIARLGTPAQY